MTAFSVFSTSQWFNFSLTLIYTQLWSPAECQKMRNLPMILIRKDIKDFNRCQIISIVIYDSSHVLFVFSKPPSHPPNPPSVRDYFNFFIEFLKDSFLYNHFVCLSLLIFLDVLKFYCSDQFVFALGSRGNAPIAGRIATGSK